MRDGEMHACLWMIILADLSVAKRSKRRNVAVSAEDEGEDHTATVRMGLTLPGWLQSHTTKTPVLDMTYYTDFPNDWHECTNTSVANSRMWGPISPQSAATSRVGLVAETRTARSICVST